MIAQDQSETVHFMKGVSVADAAGETELIETHISFIFLAGDRAFKMKRAVKLPYVDFSTPQMRLETCEKELALNAPTAPGLYLGVRRITRESDGALGLDGAGELVDAVVEMRRFDQDRLLDKMAASGALSATLMDDVAAMIAEFHAGAPVCRSPGGVAGMAGVLDINEAGFATSRLFVGAELDRFKAAFRSALAGHARLLDARSGRGLVRRCHGDLHLRNICMLDGRPRLFDCIEFNDAIATVDVLYDLAFLLMDLWHRGHPDFANLVANRYLDATGDDGGFVLLPFFMAVRAAVRAHVIATQADEGAGDKGELERQARSYFDLAVRLLETKAPLLVAIGGLSGSGKSTVAEALAPYLGMPPGARMLESDRIRKALHGVSAQTRLPPEAYRPEMSIRVYDELAGRAAELLSSGATVTVNAVYDRPADRTQIARAATDAGVPFRGIWLEVDEATLRRRVQDRVGGASDATIEVLERQIATDRGPIEWRHVDAGRPVAGTVQAIIDDVEEAVPVDGKTHRGLKHHQPEKPS